MSDPLGDPPLHALSPRSRGAKPSSIEDDAVNLLDGSIEPTDDSPTVISKTPQPQPSARADENFSGSLRGRRLAHFELIEPIGVGGMAAVLRARDTQLDRLVALKILPPEMASDVENIRRFHQEARSAAKLDHENIARVFFCGEDQRLHFIAFEFVEGENLRTILERRGRLPVGETLHYMLQVAAGLAHASRRGVVHRDIKPSNIIITPNGRAKLVDMGLARSLEPQQDMGLTQSGVTLGTFDYISPEQALEPREADVRSDIYSLGCTFYHMLTGQPPVPEGTAAKKLHHHQHVKPADPRQFVPDLPDEAAVILDRMMAKQPRDRYQTPEHLVHHLYLAARKLGAAAEVPEGVLAVEAALPSPPAGRPLVLAALAAIAVVALIFLLDQPSPPKVDTIPNSPVVSSEPKGRDDSEPPLANVKALSKGEKPTPILKPPRIEPSAPTFKPDKPTATNLAEFLQKNKDAHEIIIELADDLDLRARDDREPDLVLANPIVTIRSANAQTHPTIRYDYPARTSQALQAPLTIESKNCTVEGIRFVLDQTGASVPMTALLFRGVGQSKVTVNRCTFIQANLSGNEQKRMASVFIESSGPSSLILNECCFLGFASLGAESNGDGPSKMVFSGAASGGQDAITRRGPANIEATNCLFGPHAALFRLEGAAPDNDGHVLLNHCSVLAANQSAVYDLKEGADAHIEANYSLFSHPGDPGMAGMAEGKGAVLLRRASSEGRVTYTGYENRYHQLDSYLVVADASPETVQRLLDQIKKGDTFRELDSSPWKNPQPLKQLDQLAIETAFRVNPLAPELRLPSDGANKHLLVGVERALAFSYRENLPPLKDDPSATVAPRELIVEVRSNSDSVNRLYPTLGHAIPDVQPGDVILLRLNGEVKLDPRVLSGAKLADLTIRADKNYHPILTLSETGEDSTTALFDVCNGKLRLEGLEIRLRPGSDDFDAQAVVSFLADGECTLKDCLITLDRAGRKTALAVALLTEKRMKKSAQGPHLRLENCFVRGQGDLIFSQSGLPAEVMVKNSLVALTGSLLNVEADKDIPAPTSLLVVRLKKVTTYLSGNLIRMRAVKDLKSLAKIQCEPEDCLFVPAGDRALVHLEGPESEEPRLKDKLSWESSGKNAYGSFSTLFERQAIGVMMKMPLPSNLEAWKNDVSHEMDSEYKVKLLRSPAADLAAFPSFLPSEFRTGESLKEYGADLAALRQLPPLRGKSPVSDSEPD
jgi:serine/threonine protein kinase